MASKNAGGREASLKNGEAVRQRKVNLGAIYNFAKPAFNEVIPAPKSPINNAGSTPCGGLPRLVRPPFDRLDYCYRWFLLRFNMFMRSTTRFRAVIPRFCSRFFLPSAPGFTAVSLAGSSFFSLIFLLFLSIYYNYVLLFTPRFFLPFHFSFFLYLFLFIFPGFIWRGGCLIYIWGGLPGQKG